MQKVLKWLDEENQSPREIGDPTTDLNIAIPIDEHNNIHVIFDKNRSDSVFVVAQVGFTPLEKHAFSALTEAKKFGFIDDLNYSMLQLNIGFVFHPTAPTMESLRITKPIYFDGLTKDKLFETNLLVTRGIHIARWCYKKHLQPKSSRNITPDFFLL